MISNKDRKDFIESMTYNGAFTICLDDAVAWINESLAIEEVFDKEICEKWAEDNGYIKVEE